MHARKARMAELSDAFIALPGGLGTLEEMFEVWTWGQLGYHAKPLGLMDVNGFYSKLTDFLDHVASEGFVREQHRGMLQISESPSELLDALEAGNPWQPRSGQTKNRPDPPVKSLAETVEHTTPCARPGSQAE
jgi:hypothetical protein